MPMFLFLSLQFSICLIIYLNLILITLQLNFPHYLYRIHLQISRLNIINPKILHIIDSKH